MAGIVGKTIKVLIVDEQPASRLGLRTLLAADPRIDFVGECGDAAEALAMIPQVQPTLAIVDLLFPGAGGFELVKDIRIQHPSVAVLVFSTLNGP